MGLNNHKPFSNPPTLRLTDSFHPKGLCNFLLSKQTYMGPLNLENLSTLQITLQTFVTPAGLSSCPLT